MKIIQIAAVTMVLSGLIILDFFMCKAVMQSAGIPGLGLALLINGIAIVLIVSKYEQFKNEHDDE